MKERIHGVKDSLKRFTSRMKSISIKEKLHLKDFTHWKKAIAISAMFVMIIAVGVLVYQSGFSYQVTLNGEDVGVVKEVHIAEDALVEVETDIVEQYGEKAHFESTMAFERVRVKKENLLDQTQVSNIILQRVEVYKPAAIIHVDGEEKLVLNTTKEAEQILEKIKKPYIQKDEKSNEELLEVSFKQEVEIISEDVILEKILSKEQALDKITQISTQEQHYQVAKGDSAWNISRSFNMGIRTLEEANPDKDIEDLKPGDSINLSMQRPFIDVVTRERLIETKEIDFKVVEKKDSSSYIGQKKVDEQGKKGEKEITKEITFVNGIQESAEIVNEKVLVEPTTKVMLVGTKARPKVVSRGSTGPAPTYNGSKGAAIVSTAKHYLGVPYVSGGSTPSGFDCSGFTSYVYRQYGISIPRTSGGQASVGGYVSRSQLQPGDLVIFPGHVGIYVGGGSFIHSPRPGKSIQYGSLNSSYWSSRFRSGRRAY